MFEDVKPRAPLIFTTLPERYYIEYPLAAAIQAIEASFLSLCFRMYPQSFLHFYGALEKIAKNISGLERTRYFRQPIDRVLDLFGSKPAFLSEESTAQWSMHRNDLEHRGDSPTYDWLAAYHMLGDMWDAMDFLLKNGYSFNIYESFLPGTKNAFNFSRAVLSDVKIHSINFIEPYFMDPLVYNLRFLMRPNFLENSYDEDWYYNSNQKYEHIQKWRRDLHSHKRYEWEDVSCPICSCYYSQFGFLLIGEGNDMSIEFKKFICPDCGMLSLEHKEMPFLGKNLLRPEFEGIMRKIADEFRLLSLPIEW